MILSLFKPPSVEDVDKRLQKFQESLHNHKVTNGKNPDFFEVAEDITPSLLEGSTLLRNRYDLVRSLPKNALWAEVGTYQGRFARFILDNAQPSHLHLLDITYRFFEHSNFQNDTNLTKHEGDSSSLLKSFPEHFFDVVYVDGDHSYEGAAKDLDAAHDRLKPSGWMVCNDYMAWSHLQAQPYGVLRAVNSFINKRRYKVRYLALQREGYFDIALQKP